MRILFASTSTNQATGYGRMAYNIITYLSNMGHEIHHFAFQNYPHCCVNKDRKLPTNVRIIDVHVLSKTTYGTDIWIEQINKVKPDVIIVYNDMPVTCSLLNEMLPYPKPCPFISYLDIVYKFQKFELLEHISKYSEHIFVFSEFWKLHLVNDLGFSNNNVSVFTNGIDKNKFYNIPKDEAKKKINLKEDDFVVFNMNRNSYRKMWDVTIKAFVRFWKLSGCNSKVKLLINCRTDISEGYNFQNTIHAACSMENVDLKEISNNNIVLLSASVGGFVTDDTINNALNASDIGINTCGGEGFGLCNIEGAYLGVSQVVTNTGGLSDIFKGFDNMLVNPKLFMTLTCGIDFHTGELAICDYKDFADKLLYYYENRDVLLSDGKDVEAHVKKTYDWDNILEKFTYDLDYVLKRRTITCFYINKDVDIQNRKNMEKQKICEMNILRIKEDGQGSMKAIKKAIENDDNLTIISNDTITFPKDFRTVVDDIISKLPLTWQIVQIKFSKNKQREITIKQGKIDNPSCYAISRSGMVMIKKNNDGINFNNMLCHTAII